jgi:signal transduction histidine kinase
MIHAPPRFRRYLIISVPITILLVTLGELATQTVSRFDRARFEGEFPQTMAHLIDATFKTGSKNADAAIQKAFSSSIRGEMRFHLWLLGPDGRVIASSLPDAQLPVAWDVLPKPARPYQLGVFRRKEPHTFIRVVRLESEPTKFLLLEFVGTPPPHMFWFAFASLFFSVLLASALSFLLMFSDMRAKAKLVDGVIDELQRGNLKARFPIGKLDETGQTMLRFNRMADEIELLVERLNLSQQSRMTLLQELAHDLRTPVASLHSLLETLSEKSRTLTPELSSELSTLSLREVDYLARLVEDLLFLARAGEPRYQATQEKLDLTALLEGEIESASALYSSRHGKSLQVEKTFSIPSSEFLGDSHLLKRLFRNGLDNAFSFARAKISVSLSLSEERIEVRIRDDGPGIATEALKTFGTRKLSRLQSPNAGRLSVGLGSVIMKTIAELHRGDVEIRNRNPGCELLIRLHLLPG